MDLAMAQRLVDRRKAAGLSQEALATKLNVSRQAVSKWERSESSPDTDNLIALAALYGISLDELLYGESAERTDRGKATPVEEDDSLRTDDPSSESNPGAASEPSVNISWREGIHVNDPIKGEEVHVGWRGIHVDNEAKGEHVHIGPGGLHVDTPEDDGHSVHTNPDGTVTIDGETYHDWHEAHAKLDHHGGQFHTSVGRAWNKFPFPALLLLAYLAIGLISGSRGVGLFLAFLIPVYYALGDFIDRRQLSKLVGSIYTSAAIAWFCYQWFCLGQPHPAWLILFTIPVVRALMRWCRRQWKRHLS